MSFWDKITGNDITRQFKDFELRANKLPTDYKEVWEEINSNILTYGDFTGRNLIPILNTILDMLEETAANGQNIKDVLGNDIKSFCSEIVGDEGANSYRDKWRKQLNNNIAKKLGR